MFCASIVEVTSALRASGLLSNTHYAECCVRHAELGRLDLYFELDATRTLASLRQPLHQPQTRWLRLFWPVELAISSSLLQ